MLSDYMLFDRSTSTKKVLALGFYNRKNLGDDMYVPILQHLFPNIQCECLDDVHEVPSDVEVLLVAGGDVVNSYFILTAPTVPHAPRAATTLRVGVCLAQPAFVNNPSLLENACDKIHALLQKYPAKVLLIPFNTGRNPTESDLVVNANVTALYTTKYGVEPRLSSFSPSSDEEILSLFSTLDLAVCMRYHSCVFSLIQGTRFVALYATNKIDSLLWDTDNSKYGYRLPVDADFKPTAIDTDCVMQLIEARLGDSSLSNLPNVI